MAKGGMFGEGGHAWQGGACMAKEGMHGKGGHVWQRGCVWQGEGTCMAEGACMAGACVSIAADGMYPTRMHSCFSFCLCWGFVVNGGESGCFVVNGICQRFGNHISPVLLSSSLSLGSRDWGIRRFVQDSDALCVRSVTL